ncbi:MAG: lysophospholipid acyltransferase family protein [Hyphomicrobiales bacterium]
MEQTRFSYSEPTQPLLQQIAIRAVEKITGQPELKRLYELNQTNPVQGESFWQAAVRLLDLKIPLDDHELNAVPKTGPLVVVANHPYGVLDGIAICWLMEKIRKDFLVLTHAALLRAPEARPSLLPVDFSGTAEATAANLETRKKARTHLDQGGAIVVFPAGAISTSPDRLGQKPATDWPWQPFTAQLIQRSGAHVVPVFFHGQNSRLFQMASHISSTLRLALIFKEVYDRMGSTLDISIGAPLSPDFIASFTDRSALTEFLRQRTYALGLATKHGPTPMSWSNTSSWPELESVPATS